MGRDNAKYCWHPSSSIRGNGVGPETILRVANSLKNGSYSQYYTRFTTCSFPQRFGAICSTLK